jgi:hypothetical protein
VACERAFSVQNLQLTALRNRLTAEHVEQLVFIHINSRALIEIPAPAETMEERESHIMQAEDDLMATRAHSNQVLGKRVRGDDI